MTGWLVEQRYRAVREVLDGSSASEVAVRYGMSRQSVYAWKARHAAMKQYGVPAEVLTDNGEQFTGRFTKSRPAEVLSGRVCREHGITGKLTKPYSPRRQPHVSLHGRSLLYHLYFFHGAEHQE